MDMGDEDKGFEEVDVDADVEVEAGVRGDEGTVEAALRLGAIVYVEGESVMLWGRERRRGLKVEVGVVKTTLCRCRVGSRRTCPFSVRYGRLLLPFALNLASRAD